MKPVALSPFRKLLIFVNEFRYRRMLSEIKNGIDVLRMNIESNTIKRQKKELDKSL